MVTVLGECSLEKQVDNDNSPVHCAGEKQGDVLVMVEAENCSSYPGVDSGRSQGRFPVG